MNPVILILISLSAISASKYQIGKEESSIKVIFFALSVHKNQSKIFKIHTAFLLGRHSNFNITWGRINQN